MFTTVTIQDASGNDVTLHRSGSRRLGECQGLHGLPAPRRIVRPRPGGHGEINETKHYGSKRPIWSGKLLGDTETALWTEYDAILQALWEAVESERLMKWTRGDGTQLQSYVKLGEAFDPVIRYQDAGRVLAYQLVLDREDPRNYSQTQTVEVGDPLTDASGGVTYPATYPWQYTPSGAGEAQVSNTGTIETPVLFRVYGYASSPQLLNTSTGARVVFDGEVANGDYLEIDTFERSVKLNGSTDRTNLVDFTATDWRAGLAGPGSTTFRLLAANFDGTARVDVLYRSAFA